MYRDRKDAYVHADPLNERLVHIQTNPPNVWRSSMEYRDVYLDHYGADSLRKAVVLLRVAENIDPVCVGGTDWQKKLGAEVFKDEVAAPQPLIPGPGEYIIQTPFGPKIVKTADRKLSEMTVGEFIELLGLLLGKG